MFSSDDRPGVRGLTTATEEVGAARVLIVDDNRSFADLLSSALDTVDGVECVGTASSAAEGFQLVLELGPSVVVMDLMMPGIDGLAATRELRQLSPLTAVAVVSAHCDAEWITRAEEAGASAYIPKGGSLAEMVELLATARPGPMIVAPSLRPVSSACASPTPTRVAAPAPGSRERRHPPGPTTSQVAPRTQGSDSAPNRSRLFGLWR